MSIENPPFDPPFVSIHPTEQGAAYIETLADGTTRPLSSVEANWMQASESGTANPQLKTPPSSLKPAGKTGSQGKVFLKVPFAEKDQAKALGARWDAAQKKWYVPNGVDADLFARWRPEGF
jgi:hypothetical protein